QIDVEWDSGTADDAAYTVRLTMQVEDRQGMLAAISARVSEIDTNITGMDAQTSDEGHARIDMTVQIRDVKHLDRVIRALRGIDGVIAVERAVRM
ncbi:MAG: ACT domain-containing protein, partial [Vicinamibacterales bacterium]